MSAKTDSKWISAIGPEEPVSLAVRNTLSARLAVVSYLAPLAAAQSEQDVEYVHQLRVATRRSAAALRVFSGALPRRRRRWVERRLKRMRRAAGNARDYDVQLERMKAGDSWDEPALRPLREHLQSCRRRAQSSVVDVYCQLKRENFEAEVAELLDSVRWRGSGGRAAEPSFGVLARVILVSLVERFFSAAAGDLSQIDRLHWLRIQGKRLRYAMEIFSGAFPPSFRRKLYAEIEKVQERLGRLNDHATSVQRYRDWLESGDSPLPEALLEELIRAEEKKLGSAVKRFHRWWSPDRATRLRERFDRYLADDAWQSVSEASMPNRSPQSKSMHSQG